MTKRFIEAGIWAGNVAVCLLLAFVFFIEFKENRALRNELSQKKEELRVAQKASKKVADLEKQAGELLQREEKLHRQVTQQEYKPFALIRTITKTGAKTGLRSIRFAVLPGGQSAIAGVAEVLLQMDCEATFPQLLVFLKELAQLERIVEIRTVEIRRQPQAIPYQSVVMTLVTYTFSE